MSEWVHDVSMQIELPRTPLIEICRKYHVQQLAVFGSVLRDDFRPDSDLDFLVKFERDDAGPWMCRLSGLQEDLSGLAGRAVDVLDWKAIEQSQNHDRRQAILGEMKLLYLA